MNVRSLALPLLFAAAVLGLYFFAGGAQWAQTFASNLVPAPGLTPELSARFDNLTIPYVDPALGFSVRYPVGYPLDAPDGDSVSFYAPGPTGVSEAFVFQAVKPDYGADDLKAAAADLSADLRSQQTVTVDGRPALRLLYDLPADQVGEKAQLLQGLVPCGNYSLFLAATVPQSLHDDVALADYALYTARCG